MEEKTLIRKQYKVNLDDGHVILNSPSLGSYEDLMEAIEKDESKSLKLMREFFCGLGMPLDFARSIELEHLQQLMEMFKPKK